MERGIPLGCLGLLVGYAAVQRFQLTWRAWLFAAGVLILWLALASPLDELGDDYLFSAHMVQHLLLLQVVPPLLLMGLPAPLMRRALHWPPAARVERVLSRPVLAWTLAMGTLWLWHLPALYNFALDHEGVHVIQHLSFLVTATIYFWPVCATLPEARLQPLQMVAYLFTAAAANMLLGILLTFAPVGLYPHYLHPDDELHILPLLQGQWGLTPEIDQQIGGLVMWIAGNLVYFALILWRLAWWMEERDDEPAMATEKTSPAAPE